MKPIQKALWFAIAVTVLVPPSVWSDTVQGLNSFMAGETALASDVNANFTAIASAVNGNDSLIADNESRIQELESRAGVPGPQGEPGPQGGPGPPGEGATSIELIGFTAATFTGDQGILGYTTSCQSEFPGSRMCRSVEVADTANVPSGLAGPAWVRPVFREYLATNDTRVREVSGFGGALQQSEFQCSYWSSNSSQLRGLSVSSLGHLGRTFCDTSLAVACCGIRP